MNTEGCFQPEKTSIAYRAVWPQDQDQLRKVENEVKGM